MQNASCKSVNVLLDLRAAELSVLHIFKPSQLEHVRTVLNDQTNTSQRTCPCPLQRVNYIEQTLTRSFRTRAQHSRMRPAHQQVQLMTNIFNLLVVLESDLSKMCLYCSSGSCRTAGHHGNSGTHESDRQLYLHVRQQPDASDLRPESTDHHCAG